MAITHSPSRTSSSEHGLQQPASANLAKLNASARKSSIWGLVISCIMCLACFAVSIAGLSRYRGSPGRGTNVALGTSLSSVGAEVTAFVINIAVTYANDTLAYIHSASLRATLLTENRLKFNTSIRLFTSSRHHGPNKWYANVLSAACLILCYAATSQLIIDKITYQTAGVGDNAGFQDRFYINIIALLALAVGLLGNIAISASCLLLTMKSHALWLANPLSVTMTAICSSLLHHRPGRSMLPAKSKTESGQPSKPTTRQQSIYQSRPTMRWVLALMWILVIFVLGWFLAITLLVRNSPVAGRGWRFSVSWKQSDTYEVGWDLPVYGSEEKERPFGWQLLIGILLLCAIQSLQTICLHCIEMVVNMHRDEDAWKQTCQKNQYTKTLAVPPFIAAAVSWKNAILFIMKAAIHWLLGQALNSSWFDDQESKAFWFPYQYQFSIYYPQLFWFFVVNFGLAIFVTVLMFHRPRSVQPAAWGHLQTLADLIDDWELDANERLWWGDKGVIDEANGVHHAGTSPKKQSLAPVDKDVLYL